MTACSLRDILVSRRRDQRAHDERACALANAHLDAVLVHCDPRLRPARGVVRRARAAARAGRTTPASSSPAARRRAARRERFVVSAGGGLVGGAAAARRRRGAARPLAAHRPADAPDRGSVPARTRTGPRSAAARRRASSSSAPCPTSAPSCAKRAASVSQCGYNTALELVRAGVPALVVPYATAEEDEQRRRARRLARLGAVRVLDPALLDPRALARELELLLEFEPAPAAARPRRRAPDLRAAVGARRPGGGEDGMSAADERAGRPQEPHERAGAHAAAVLRAPVARARRRRRRDSRADGRRAREAVAARARRRPPARRARGAVRPRRRRLAAAGCRGGARDRHRARRGGRAVRLRPVAAERGRAHHARAADRGLRPPPAALARLPPAAPEGRPDHRA